MKKITTLLFLTFAFTFASMAQIVLTVDSANYVDANGVPLDTVDQIQVSGVVMGPNSYPTPNGDVFMLTSHTRGIQVYSKHRFGYTVNTGDSVVVVGKVSTYHGMAQISPSTSEAGDTIYRVGTGVIDTPLVITQLTEANEAMLVQFNNVDMSLVSGWPATHTSHSFSSAKVVIGSYTLYFYVDSFMSPDLWNGAAPAAGIYNVRGFGNQYVSAAPYHGGYSLQPRSRADFILQTQNIDTAGITTISSLTAAVYPNPASTKLTVTFDSHTSDVYTARIVDLMGQTVLSDNGAVYSGANDIIFNTSSLSNGIYILEVNAGGKTLVAKVNISK
jgi:hypothetical protein